ncbi:MAG: ABC transporter ATP-binding protein/permease [Planctomycetota bacterium]|nr:ABC transporter ATP-binding protein/permease [Planctomycetota bacterium]
MTHGFGGGGRGFGGGGRLTPASSDEEESVSLSYLKKIFPYLRPYRTAIFLGFFGSLITKGGQVISPFFVGKAVDAIVLWNDQTLVYWCIGAIMLAIITEVSGEFIWRTTLVGTSYQVETDIRNKFFSHVLKMSHSWFDKARTGDLMSRATSDIGTIRGMVEFGLVSIVRNTILCIGALALMLRISPFLTLLSLAPLAGLTITVRLMGPMLHRRAREVQEQIAEVSAKAQENFTGIRVVKSYGMEEAEKNRFAALSKDYYKKTMSLAKASAFLHTLLGMIFETAILLILFVGGRSIIFGKLSYGEFVEFIGYQMMLIWPMISFGMIIAVMQRGAASLYRIEKILSEDVQIVEPQDTVEMKSLRGDIIIRNLNFSYNATPVLKELNLKIEGGKVTAITGPVGCGKSTLVLLLSRLYEVPEGTIFYGGVDVRKIPLRLLHRKIAYAPQEPFLFSETVADNIKFGKPEATDEEVRYYAKLAGIAEEIEELPDKYAQIVGERGVTLSGGQKQRVSLARALISQPDVLIMDDTLSSVDSQKEDEIMNGLRDYFKGRTVIIVSHRISTLKYADKIVVISEGRIVEEGSHQELTTKNGLYKQLYERQRIKEMVAETR